MRARARVKSSCSFSIGNRQIPALGVVKMRTVSNTSNSTLHRSPLRWSQPPLLLGNCQQRTALRDRSRHRGRSTNIGTPQAKATSRSTLFVPNGCVRIQVRFQSFLLPTGKLSQHNLGNQVPKAIVDTVFERTSPESSGVWALWVVWIVAP